MGAADAGSGTGADRASALTRASAEVDALLAPEDAARAARHRIAAPRGFVVQTAYIPADRFTKTSPSDWRGVAQETLQRAAPSARVMAEALDTDVAALEVPFDRMVEKLRRQPIEDIRVDFEDGLGWRSDDVEDALAVRTARDLGSVMAGEDTALACGLRMKGMGQVSRQRGLRTLWTFCHELHGSAGIPEGFRITLPKVTCVAEVTAMARACDRLEESLGLARGTLGFEIQIETPDAVIDVDGTIPIPRMIEASEGRCRGLHFGTYDYTTSNAIAAQWQGMSHPAADFAKSFMQVSANALGVPVADGSSIEIPQGDIPAVHAAWRTHFGLVRRGLRRGFYQGWDLHGAQLPTRYLAVYDFFLAGLPAAGRRLANYCAGAETGVLDEPATARSLAGFLMRGWQSGALTEDELRDASGLTLTQIADYAEVPAP